MRSSLETCGLKGVQVAQPFPCERAGSLLLSVEPPSPQAALYFHVNRVETDRWFVRTCELRSLALSSTAMMPHGTVHTTYVWLRQLLSVLRHFAVEAAEAHRVAEGGGAGKEGGARLQAGADPLKGRGGSGSAEGPGGIAATQAPPEVKVPQKTIRILQPQGPREVSLPRSVNKRPLPARAATLTVPASAHAPSHGSNTSVAGANKGTPGPSQGGPGLPREAVSPLKMPRRLITSMIQLMHVLTTALTDMRESNELRRLHRTCTIALCPVLEHLMAPPITSQGSVGTTQATACSAAALTEDGGHVSFAGLAPTAREASERLLEFVLAAVHRVEGRFEDAAALFQSAAAVAEWVPQLTGEHSVFCTRQAAACYAALTDWPALAACGLPEGSVVSAGVQARCDLRSMRTWAPPPELSAAPHPVPPSLTPLATATPIHLSALLDGAFAEADGLLHRLYPRPSANTPTADELRAAVTRLHTSVMSTVAALRHTKHDGRAAPAAELLAATHTAAALTQLLNARLPPTAIAPLPPGFLSTACAAHNPCEHLLTASALLECPGTPADLLSSSALTLQLTPFSATLCAAGSTVPALDTSQLPLHMYVFAAAKMLASAHEYSILGATSAKQGLPSKESALQVLSQLVLVRCTAVVCLLALGHGRTVALALRVRRGNTQLTQTFAVR
jgi:hypothetical protein